jgi:hypothetical protein
MTTSQNIVPVLEASTSLENRVLATIATSDAMKREAAARAAIETAMVSMVGEAAKTLPRRGQGPAKVRKPAPMSAIRIGRMAEVAWERMTPVERQLGLPLWKLAALANLHFIPVPMRKLHELHQSVMVFELEKPVTGPADPNVIPKPGRRRLGFAFVQRPMPGMGQQLLGIKIFDHEGRTLIVAGQAPLAETEKISPFTEGIFNGSDELPENWVYRTKAQVASIEITQFIRASLPRRQEL